MLAERHSRIATKPHRNKRLCASIDPILGKQQIDRFLSQSLGRSFMVKGKLAELLPGKWIEVDRQDAFPFSAQRTPRRSRR